MFIVPGVMYSGTIVIHSIVASNHGKEKLNSPPPTHKIWHVSDLIRRHLTSLSP